MRIKTWGVRGSIPHSLDPTNWARHFEKIMKDFFEKGFNKAGDIEKYLQSKPVTEIGGFGVSTTCVEVTDGESSLIIDGGSGIKAISDSLGDNHAPEFHILISHFHFDHLLGLPFFLPHFKSGCRINYYSVQSETESVIKSLFQKPLFPVSFGNLNSEISFHRLQLHKKNSINGFEVTPYRTDHPDACYGFKIEKNNKAYAHAVDNEAVRLTEAGLGPDAGLYKNVNLVYFDSQYDEDNIEGKKGWGHGTSHRGFEICSNFGIKQILFAHHDPAFSIEDSLNQKKKTAQIYQEKYSHLKLRWDMAYDGMVIEL
ncbi:MAG: MBL fold metallo-hydrolase [Pseudobdellovibrio sp.]